MVQNTRKVVIMGDRNIKGFSFLIKQKVEGKIDVDSQMRPGLLLQEMLLELTPLCQNFTNNDFVIIFIGSENAIKNKPIDDAKVTNFLNKCNETNLIFIGPLTGITDQSSIK